MYTLATGERDTSSEEPKAALYGMNLLHKNIRQPPAPSYTPGDLRCMSSCKKIGGDVERKEDWNVALLYRMTRGY